MRSPSRPLAIVVGPLLIAWAVVFAAVPPHAQEFALNDDVVFNASLFDVLNGLGRPDIGWAAAPQLGQWLWAAPFVLALGQSFFVTRLATIVLSMLGAWALFDLLRRERQLSDGVAAIATAAYSVNPLLFMTSGTFMTDVPAVSFSLIALWAVSRMVDSGRSSVAQAWYALAGTAAAVLATTTRQNALVVPCVIGVILYGSRAAVARRPWLALSAIVPLIAGLTAAFWFTRKPDAVLVVPQAPSHDRLVEIPAAIVIYLGLFIVPMVLLVPWRRHLRTAAISVAMVAAGAAGWILYLRQFQGRTILEGGLFPYIGNTLTVYGSFGTNLVLGSRPIVLGERLRYALTLIACIGGGWLLLQLVRYVIHLVRNAGWNARVDPLVAFGILHVPFLYIAPNMFDRYLLPLLPAAISLCLWRSAHDGNAPSRPAVATAAALVTVMGISSIALTHDWLAWNAARWTLGRRTLATGRPAAAIEGGFEWDAWFALQEGRWRKSREMQPPQALAIPFNARLVTGLTGECGLSFSDVSGTVAVDKEPYQSWLTGTTQEFLLLCRKAQ